MRDYLSFSKKDRIALAFILLVVAGCWLLPFFLHRAGGVRVSVDSTLIHAADSLADKQPVAALESAEADPYSEYAQPPKFMKGERFPFDPNTLPAQGWARLGLPEKNIRTIHNYRNRGGRFYKKEDLQKIWGLPPGFYDWVEPYIRIAPKEKMEARTPHENTRRAMPARTVDANSADSAAWVALPGIGSRLAARILRFRERLGGFYSADQVAETYGLPDSTFQKLRPLLQVDPNQINRININTATKEELRLHPYIRWNLANAIVEYRSQHGLFKDIRELKKIVLVDDSVFGRVSPYLVLE